MGPDCRGARDALIVLLFCDITPKTFALGFPSAVAWMTARPLAMLADLVHPLARPFTPLEQAPRPGPVSEQEFKTLLRLGENQGQVEPEERAMIHRVFDFGARRAAEVMTPRDRIFSLDIEMPVAQLVAEIAHESFSRVAGLSSQPGQHRGNSARQGSRSAAPGAVAAAGRAPGAARVFVPPGKRLADLFEEMRRGRFQMALVVNEFGRLLGLVTLEDLLEELFGEIRDEFRQRSSRAHQNFR